MPKDYKFKPGEPWPCFELSEEERKERYDGKDHGIDLEEELTKVLLEDND